MRAFVVLSVVACAAVFLGIVIGCGESPPPVTEAPDEPAPPPPPPPPKPKPKPIQLAALDNVSLLPGAEASVELRVERNENDGPIQVDVGNVPEGVAVTAPEIPAGESTGQLQLAADISLGESDLMSLLPVTATVGDVKAEQTLRLTVRKISLPTFLPATGVMLQPGTNQTVDLAIQRNGHQGPLELSVEIAPAKVLCKIVPIPSEGDSTRLEIAAAADAPNAKQNVRVAGTVFGRTVAVEIPVQVVSQPFRVETFQVVTLEPGATQFIDLPIHRSGYQGPIQLDVQDLPEGVTVKGAEVAAGQAKASLEITAVEDAEQRVRSSKIVSTAGHLTANGPIVIRVSRGDDTYLPSAIAANPEIAPLLRRGSMGGRLTTESKQALLDFYGGTSDSEEAVMRGLRWLAAHQQQDGSWPLYAYSANIAGCDCKTDFEKDLDKCDTAGTAFAVLAFLGAGVTHNRAPKHPPELAQYKKVVEDGLMFLGKNQVTSGEKSVGHMGGSMYAHTLGAIAFCESYGLSGDERCKINAQLSIKYLLDAQHKAGGGWRYSPSQAGDMSVTGWVILAIRSAQLAGLTVDRGPLIRAERFVESCAVGPEDAEESRYAYQSGQAEKLTLTAAGLLTRQYLGWRKDQADLLAGCEYLMKSMPPESGTSLGKIYYYYYATQVLHHMEGSNFDLWNERMREHLIRTQEESGHKAGSWNPQGTDHGARGGRIYATCMALLTLQTYYRHLPMYRPVKYAGR